MGVIERLLGRRKKIIEQPKNNVLEEKETEWQQLPAFIDSAESEHQLVSLIATSIAAGDYPNSQFVVKKIMKRNPEVHLVSLIAASLEAAAMNGSRLNIKGIAKKK